MPLDPHEVDVVLAQQEAAVTERVHRTRLDTDQPDEIRRVRAVLPAIVDRLGRPEFLTTLANPDSKRATFVVGWPDGTKGVLKVAGCIEHGEAETLRAWRDAGVPAVRVLAAGDLDGCTYIVTAYEVAPSMKRVFEERLLGEAHAIRAGSPAGADPLLTTLTEMLTTLRRAHVDAAGLRGVHPLSERLEAPIRVGVGRLHALGIASPPGFDAAVASLDEGPSVLLHGDPWVGNLLYNRGCVLIDPAACHGPAEYDAAQAIAQITPPARIAEMVGLAASLDPALDPGRIFRYIGLFHTIDAGRRTAGISHMADSTFARHESSPDVAVRRLLSAARVSLLAPLRGEGGGRALGL